MYFSRGLAIVSRRTGISVVQLMVLKLISSVLGGRFLCTAESERCVRSWRIGISVVQSMVLELLLSMLERRKSLANR